MRTLKTLGAGMGVYLTMAACSALSGDKASDAPADAGHLVDAIGDAIGNPVDDAHAAPDVAVEQCNKTFDYGAQTYAYAEHAYPGKTKVDLTAVRALLHYKAGAPVGAPTGYGDSYVIGGYVKDGAVAQQCGLASNPNVDSVTFILP